MATLPRFSMPPPTATDVERLQSKYHMPPQLWWARADVSFTDLCNVLERQLSEEIEYLPLENNSARRANASSYPVVRLVKASTHLLQLSALNETLRCVAFGTINIQRYHQIFWEEIANLQRLKGHESVAVFSDQNNNNSVTFNFRYGEHNFEIVYIRWDAIRTTPNIMEVELPPSLESSVVSILSKSQQDCKLSTIFATEKARFAYYYVRAWAVNRGIYREENVEKAAVLHSADLVRLLAVSNPETLTISSILSSFFRNLSKDPKFSDWFGGKDAFRTEIEAKNWLDLLENVRLQPLRTKVGLPHYLKIGLTYGGSGMKCGQAIAAIDQSIPKLLKRLSDSLSGGSAIRLLPVRLVEDESSNSEVYEAFIIIGLDFANEDVDLPRAEAATAQWADRVLQMNNGGISSGFYLYTVCVKASESEEVLVPCHRRWPSSTIKSPLGQGQVGHEETPGRARHPKNSKKHDVSQEPNPENLPTRSLRTAGDILSRLEHDAKLNIDEYRIGYKDRFTDIIQEIPAASWIKESTHDEYIPQTRIQYFRRYFENGRFEVIWDRETKTDKLFFSGNSGISN